MALPEGKKGAMRGDAILMLVKTSVLDDSWSPEQIVRFLKRMIDRVVAIVRKNEGKLARAEADYILVAWPVDLSDAD